MLQKHGEQGVKMEIIIKYFVSVVSIISQFIGICVVSIGMVKAFLIYFKRTIARKEAVETITRSRLELGHSFSLGLGFLIGASIIKTTVAPTWQDIGQLASIITIRTILNFFMTRDIEKLSSNKDKK